MNTIQPENCTFLIIDVQEKLVNMLTNKDIAKNAIILAKTAGILKIETIITEQYPKGLGNTLEEIRSSMQNVKSIEKTHFSAVKEADFPKINTKQIIIFGIETHICVLQTAIELINKGFEVFVVEDACGSRADKNKESALKRLRFAGVQVVTTEMVLFELLQDSKHSKFKEIQALIK